MNVRACVCSLTSVVWNRIIPSFPLALASFLPAFHLTWVLQRLLKRGPIPPQLASKQLQVSLFLSIISCVLYPLYLPHICDSYCLQRFFRIKYCICHTNLIYCVEYLFCLLLSSPSWHMLNCSLQIFEQRAYSLFC